MTRKIVIADTRRTINKIIVHCDASEDSYPTSYLKLLHTLPEDFKIEWGGSQVSCKGWEDVAYHYIIEQPGNIVEGRPINKIGAHCYGQNRKSVGICVRGLRKFTHAQKTSLWHLVDHLTDKFNLDPREDVYPHNHFNKNKSCPNFNLPDFYKGSEFNIKEAVSIGGMEGL